MVYTPQGGLIKIHRVGKTVRTPRPLWTSAQVTGSSHVTSHVTLHAISTTTGRGLVISVTVVLCLWHLLMSGVERIRFPAVVALLFVNPSSPSPSPSPPPSPSSSSLSLSSLSLSFLSPSLATVRLCRSAYVRHTTHSYIHPRPEAAFVNAVGSELNLLRRRDVQSAAAPGCRAALCFSRYSVT